MIDVLRLRSVDGERIQLVASYIPFEICPALATVDLTNRSLYDFMELECGIFIARGRRYVEAVLASETEATLLGIERGAPLLLLDSISFSETGQAVEYYHALHRADRSRFRGRAPSNTRTRHAGCFVRLGSSAAGASDFVLVMRGAGPEFASSRMQTGIEQPGPLRRHTRL